MTWIVLMHSFKERSRSEVQFGRVQLAQKAQGPTKPGNKLRLVVTIIYRSSDFQSSQFSHFRIFNNHSLMIKSTQQITLIHRKIYVHVYLS